MLHAVKKCNQTGLEIATLIRFFFLHKMHARFPEPVTVPAHVKHLHLSFCDVQLNRASVMHAG